jgi:type VI secretion system secreted protein VgrG
MTPLTPSGRRPAWARLTLWLGLAALLLPADGQAGPGNSFNTRRFPRDRQVLTSADNRRAFPNLGNNFEVLSPASARYNCISHTLGIHDQWINPRTGPADNALGPMDRMYAAQGYIRAKNLDFRLAPGRQKVVVYARTRNGQISEVTHAAIQSRDGTWTSKLGKLALIRHASPSSLTGPDYGVPVAVYVRSVR